MIFNINSTRGHTGSLLVSKIGERFYHVSYWDDTSAFVPFSVVEEEEEEEETLFVNGMYNYIVWVQSSTIKQ